MNREEFMIELEQLLQDIPQEERDEAIAYYHGYFEDAGEENEEKIIQELVSPQQVAKTIKTDMGIDDKIEYTEHGYQDQRFSDKQDINTSIEADKNEYDNQAQDENKTLKTVLIVIIAILTSPVWLSLLGGIAGVVLGAIGTVLGLIFALVLVVAAFYLAAFALVGAGVAELAGGLAAAGLAFSGTGLIFLALAVLGTILCVWLFGKFIPWFFREIIALCKRLFQARKKGME